MVKTFDVFSNRPFCLKPCNAVLGNAWCTTVLIVFMHFMVVTAHILLEDKPVVRFVKKRLRKQGALGEHPSTRIYMIKHAVITIPEKQMLCCDITFLLTGQGGRYFRPFCLITTMWQRWTCLGFPNPSQIKNSHFKIQSKSDKLAVHISKSCLNPEFYQSWSAKGKINPA